MTLLNFKYYVLLQEYVDFPKEVEFKAAATFSRTRTRQSVDMEPDEIVCYDPARVYVIIADIRDYSDGFCLAKCIKSGEDSFVGMYLEKVSVTESDVIFKATSYRSKFVAETVLSTILSITEQSNGEYSVSNSEIDEIIFSVNSIANM